jgi:hypothetical protein
MAEEPLFVTDGRGNQTTAPDLAPTPLMALEMAVAQTPVEPPPVQAQAPTPPANPDPTSLFARIERPVPVEKITPAFDFAKPPEVTPVFSFAKPAEPAPVVSPASPKADTDAESDEESGEETDVESGDESGESDAPSESVLPPPPPKDAPLFVFPAQSEMPNFDSPPSSPEAPAKKAPVNWFPAPPVPAQPLPAFNPRNYLPSPHAAPTLRTFAPAQPLPAFNPAPTLPTFGPVPTLPAYSPVAQFKAFPLQSITPRDQRREDCMKFMTEELLLEPKDGILTQHVRSIVGDLVVEAVKSHQAGMCVGRTRPSLTLSRGGHPKKAGFEVLHSLAVHYMDQPPQTPGSRAKGQAASGKGCQSDQTIEGGV